MPQSEKISRLEMEDKRTEEIAGFEQGEYPYAERLSRSDYEAELVSDM